MTRVPPADGPDPGHAMHGGSMNQHERSRLCDRMVGEFDLPGNASYQDACRRVGEVMSNLLDARVELRFITTRTTMCLNGATARRPDGTYVIYCAQSRSWYHRLGILLHELSHFLLGHQPVSLSAEDSVRRFAPHLPSRMIQLIARRTTHSQTEEQEAEELADELLERLTEHQGLVEGPASAALAPHVMRMAEGLAPDMDRGSNLDDL